MFSALKPTTGPAAAFTMPEPTISAAASTAGAEPTPPAAFAGLATRSDPSRATIAITAPARRDAGQARPDERAMTGGIMGPLLLK